MISIIITSFKEPKTIGKSIIAIEKQSLPKHETIVIAPDNETLNAAKKYQNRFSSLRLIKDSGAGKPSALNLAVRKAKGEILILTDGDVYLNNDSISNLLKAFKDKKIGAVSGRPISVNSKSNKYGYWAHLLTEIANETRVEAIKREKKIFCSGYLFAIRKKIFPKLPVELLSEDGYISEKVYGQRFLISYAPQAKVSVLYPDNFKDWIIQKKRSAGGYNQLKKMLGTSPRSFGTESAGAFRFFKYVYGPKQFIWLVELFFARVYLWLAIYMDINLKKKSREEIWKRVESTK